ncbi:ATP-dependent DNA helicase [Psychroflexus salis]|uniref:ATP-dependent exodeoxyribonuclease n=1 Tax=Psychroflexus salis TaxID=1526574 RepID=A0A917EAG3_9FLAO|nr:AAA family ATPase [Psychroflexus salis]GGE15081.1 ATP-dependent exodeoxyribonuclease [Psychroflexus salis]
MTSKQFYLLLKKDLGHTATQKQDLGLQLLSKFIVDEHLDYIYVLKGYAGTGKTTMIGTLVKNIGKIRKKLILTAPTGRAAKVISNYSKQHAQTVHRKIYYPKKTSGGGVDFVPQQNKHKNTIFIVDEASMIPDIPTGEDLFKSNSLLEDLIEYVYAGENCQLIFIGDTAQLPPVKAELSPALSEETLQRQFGMEVISVELDEVVRQELESDILRNATLIRTALQEEIYESFQFELTGKSDLIRLVDGYEIMDAINDAYHNNGHEDTAIIVRSNKRANLYNQQIRTRILYREDELAPGDYLMVVKNNYFWVKPNSDAGFIANGDIIEILEIFRFKELYGFRFAEVNVQMVDYPNMKPFETVLLLDTLDANAPSLSYEQSNQLYQEVMKDYEDERSKYKKFLNVKQNKYFNALQVKFSYAITCHKSQGGQWNTVFVEQPYLPNGIDKDYLRWLYTAITRAKDKLYLIGFKDDFFTETNLEE